MSGEKSTNILKRYKIFRLIISTEKQFMVVIQIFWKEQLINPFWQERNAQYFLLNLECSMSKVNGACVYFCMPLRKSSLPGPCVWTLRPTFRHN